MVLCAVCDVWQHAICFALLSENDVPETHICVQCSQVSMRLVSYPDRLKIRGEENVSPPNFKTVWVLD